ncbi:mannose-1-phosphate guanylyltransferase/mannose-6-phosphate isomerase [Roseospira navarrensis]|uniref:mannose-1-phosphate guanylyltransferase n=1 Tax=Roseospira navarrensis TaxID=140058 RepID=A0A7X2D588_9PROT|nr:mannose-1-phosphate guanylyltransferase/mannose-6-phosphate isomerase [Roseospira navarrensis]MQX37432.1 mannose-1-phosphate guanylyltransferase/mannose-6-phosphate isomerase [Roseospira navarrensis]
MTSPTSAERPLIPVVLSGGSGTRLWPLSRAGYPKQFLPLAGGAHSLIQQTVARVSGPGFAAPLIVCNDEHRFLVAEQMRAIRCEPEAIILEPVGRNTAPAVAVAALRALAAAESGADALLLVLPSDHVIQDVAAFHAALTVGRQAAEAGRLVTFGITPTAPETGYGYIQAEAPLPGADGAFALHRFVEKPDEETARGYVADGSYSWNSGIFLLSARAYLDELEAHAPAILAAARAALEGAASDLTFLRLDATAFATAPSDSIDYAVMEHTRRGAVVPVDMGWSDLGAWSSLWDLGEKDAHGNVSRGDVILEDTASSYVQSEAGLVAVSGLSDVIVIATDDAVLVCPRHGAQGVKQVVDRLKAAGRQEFSLHTTVHRPWGSYRGVDAGERYQVKRIVVHPGERLSLQMHYHRAEHWIVVHGMARVTRGEETVLLGENESTFIRPGQVHQLENPGKVPLHLIEVQSGTYLGEDDIVRLEDRYGRVSSGTGAAS